MLILRRRAGESLLIGGDIEIEFLELSQQSVKIGVKAPRQVCVLRKELSVTRAQNRAAAAAVDLESLSRSFEKFES